MRLPLLIGLASLALTTVSRAADADEYAPHHDGDEWIMDAVIVSPQGAITNATIHRKRSGTEERNGKTYARTRTWLEGGPFAFDETKLTRKDATGFYSLDPKDPNAAEKVELLLPLKVGQTWPKRIGQLNATDTVIGRETVTLNGETYQNCFHIRTASPDGKYTEDYWEAPKVGGIKSVIDYGNGASITLAVREFKPGK